MQKIKKESSAGAVIYYFDKEPYFLLLKYTTYWGFAKGIIEKREKIKETALREIKEETGLEEHIIEIIPGFKYKQQWFFMLKGSLVRKEAVFLLAKIKKEDKEKVKISFEHEDFAWLNLEDALRLIKIKSNKEILEKAYKFILEREKQKRLPIR